MESSNKIRGICFNGYGADMVHEIAYRCDESCKEDICRCSTIINQHVSSTNIPDIAEKIYDELFNKRNDTINSILYGFNIDVYCIERLLRCHYIWKESNWDIEVFSGYYGEEVGDVNICEETADSLLRDIECVLKMASLNEKMEFLLTKEYGFLLDDLKDVNYSFRRLKKSEISVGNKDYAEKSSTNCKFYSDKIYSGIRAVVIKTPGGYRLIDGYHRMSATDSEYIDAIIAE